MKSRYLARVLNEWRIQDFPTHVPIFILYFNAAIKQVRTCNFRSLNKIELTPQFLHVQLWPQLHELGPVQLQVDPQSQAIVIYE